MTQEETIRQHAPMVWRLLLRIVGSRRAADAEDCFQEVFVAALGVHRRTGVRNWEALLKRLAVTKGIDALRRRGRERMRGAGEGDFDHVPSSAAAPDHLAQQAELIEQLRRALAEAPPEDGELFAMRYVAGMSSEEIARDRQTTSNAVRVALSRARARLSERMGVKPCQSNGDV